MTSPASDSTNGTYGTYGAAGSVDRADRADDFAGSWAPHGWEPGDPGLCDDAPFGSVLGDPLMGSPLFDVSVFGDTPDGGAGGTGGGSRPAAQGRPGRGSREAAELRARAEAQQQALRRDVQRN